MSVSFCLCAGPGCLPFPSSNACWDILQPSLNREKKHGYVKWLNGRITMNDVKYLIEGGFKHLRAYAWAFIGKHHLPVNKCVGNKCDRRGELWASSINHGCPDFLSYPRVVSLSLSPSFLLSLTVLLITRHFSSLIKILPPSSSCFSCCCHFLYVFASPISFLLFFTSFCSSLRHIRRWECVREREGERKRDTGPGDGTWPHVVIGIPVLWQLPHYCNCLGFVVIA